MIRAFRDWFLDQLAMYAAYHKDRRNQLTHYVGVPLIVFAILIALAEVRLGQSFSGATVLLGVLLLGYLVAVPAVGLLSVLAYVPLLLGAESVAGQERPLQWAVAGASFVGGWVIQFLGHVFERRRPAFLTNILQVFMAPAFLVAEVMFAIGLQRGLADILRARAQKYARS
jgi:uncharacterized membrane protein YGL010W